MGSWHMVQDDQMSVEVAVDGFPMVCPEPLRGLRIVLLRQVDREDGWDLDFATVGMETRSLWVEAHDDQGNEYTLSTSSNSSDDHLVQGTYTSSLASAKPPAR